MSPSTFVSLFAATILVASLLISPTSGVTQDTITKICSHARYPGGPSTCEKTLNSDPRTHKASLQELPEISVQMMKEQADMNLKGFAELRDNSTTKEEKQAYGKCVKLYNAMEDKIKEAHKLSMQKQYQKVLDLVIELRRLANTCDINQSMKSKCQVSELVNLQKCGTG